MQHRSPSSLRNALRQPPAIVVGRTAAACAHPVAAWRVLTPPCRIVLLAIYTVASYVMVLSGLVALRP